MSVRITSASETPDRAIQPQTKPSSPRRSKKRTLKVVFFTSIILPVCGTPWEPTSTKILCGPLIWRPQPMVKGIEGYPIFALGAQNPDKPPSCRPTAPPSMPSPAPAAPRDVDDVSMGRADRGSSIALTGLWCPDGSPPTARTPLPPLPSRSRRDTSPADALRGEQLRSEGTDNALKAHRKSAAVDSGGRVSRAESK